MNLKKLLTSVFILYTHCLFGQKILFADNFETKKIDSSWQIVAGNWRIGDVEKFRIAPAEKGFRYVLCSGDKGYAGDQIINMAVDIPDSLQSKKIKLSFSYYILANATGTRLETEFFQKEIKDGLRGNPFFSYLKKAPGRWVVFKKTMQVPKNANSLRITLYGLETSGVKDWFVCYDNIVISY